MVTDDAELLEFMRIIANGNVAAATRTLKQASSLATARLEQLGATRQTASEYYLEVIGHYLYRGDTALHIAAAGYQPKLAQLLVTAGADVNARNRRGAAPLHYAADGQPDSAHWRPDAQAATITFLLSAGADANATDRSGVAPLHRAVRTRCAAAVAALLDGGADAQLANRSGSTPMTMATQTTGRGGSGSAEAKAQQADIIELLSRQSAAGSTLRSIRRTPAQIRTLKAALSLFAEHGVSGTSLKMIAEATGVTKAAIFYQFATKDEIVLAVAELEMAILEAAVENAERQSSRKKVRDALLRDVIDIAVGRRQLVSALQNDPVMIRLLASHEPLVKLLERTYSLILDDARPRSRVRLAMMGATIGAAVVNPLVADLDDETLRVELLDAARRLFGLTA